MSTEEPLLQILKSLHSSTPDLEGAAVIGMDGSIIACSLPGSVDEDAVSAMSAALYGIASKTAEELQRGEVEQFFIKGNNGYMLITRAGSQTLLGIMASPKANLGIIFLKVRRAAEEVAKAHVVERGS